jgi:hypothetical protein
MKLTRRELAAALAASAPLAGQAPGAQPENPAEELKAATERLRRSTETVSKFTLPMATEPAFSFRA